MHPPTRDHIRPRSRISAPLGAVNRAYVCEPCNVDKDDRTLIEWLAALIERGDHRAHRVAGVIQGLCSRGRHDLCSDQGG